MRPSTMLHRWERVFHQEIWPNTKTPGPGKTKHGHNIIQWKFTYFNKYTWNCPHSNESLTCVSKFQTKVFELEGQEKYRFWVLLPNSDLPEVAVIRFVIHWSLAHLYICSTTMQAGLQFLEWCSICKPCTELCLLLLTSKTYNLHSHW